MVLQKTQLDIVVGIGRFLPGDRLGVPAQGELSLQIVLELGEDVIVVANIEGLENL